MSAPRGRGDGAGRPEHRRARRLPLEYRVIALQLATAAVATLGVLPFGPGVARSVALGAGCAILPNAWFAWRARRAGGGGALHEAARLVFGILQKLALTVLLLWWALDGVGVEAPGAFFGAFVVTLMVHHAAPLLDPRGPGTTGE